MAVSLYSCLGSVMVDVWEVRVCFCGCHPCGVRGVQVRTDVIRRHLNVFLRSICVV